MLENIVEVGKNWFGKSRESMALEIPSEVGSRNPDSSREGKIKRKRSLLDDLEAYLFARYDFRFNVLTEQTEYRRKGEGVFMQVDQRVRSKFECL